MHIIMSSHRGSMAWRAGYLTFYMSAEVYDEDALADTVSAFQVRAAAT